MPCSGQASLVSQAVLFAGWTQNQFFRIIWPRAGQGASAVWGMTSSAGTLTNSACKASFLSSAIIFSHLQDLRTEEELPHAQQQTQGSQTTATEGLRLLPLPTLSQCHLFSISELKSNDIFPQERSSRKCHL